MVNAFKKKREKGNKILQLQAAEKLVVGQRLGFNATKSIVTMLYLTWQAKQAQQTVLNKLCKALESDEMSHQVEILCLMKRSPSSGNTIV